MSHKDALVKEIKVFLWHNVFSPTSRAHRLFFVKNHQATCRWKLILSVFFRIPYNEYQASCSCRCVGGVKEKEMTQLFTKTRGCGFYIRGLARRGKRPIYS